MIPDRDLNSIFKILNDTQIDVIEMLNDTNTEAKQQFMNDPSAPVPASRYDKLEPEKLVQSIKALEKLTAELPSHTDSTSLLIKLLAEDSLARNRLAYASFRFNSGESSSEAEHRELNARIYGMPDKEVYMDILSHLLKVIRPEDMQSREAEDYSRLTELLPELPEDGRDLYTPSQELFSRVHDAALEFYAPFLRHIPEGDTFGMQDICRISEEILTAELGGAASRWSVVFDRDRAYACVDQLARTIRFPGKRNVPAYTREKLISLIIHEVGVHVLRELVYDDITIEPLRTGLPGYEEIDEGIAKVMEQAVTGRFEHSGLYHHVSIGLAVFYGLGFREIYEIQRRIFRLAGLTEGAAYDSVQRALRGTNRLPNCKDLVYFNGTLKIWDHIAANIDSPTLFDDLLLSGKTNIFDPDHRRLIYHLKVGSAP